jgi:uncharacterized PurR-regulated membrane protein YhhQ (DUF165 family)
METTIPKTPYLTGAFLAMVILVAGSNYLVEFPINNWLTWGALTYPMTFLVTELTNRTYGPQVARRIVYAGFLVAVVISVILATPRIAFASGLAFLVSQLLDISVFNQLRKQSWWIAPFFASFLASLVDTGIFWTAAFIGEPFPWMTLATGDFGVKLAVDVTMLLPFRLFTLRRFSLSN